MHWGPCHAVRTGPVCHRSPYCVGMAAYPLQSGYLGCVMLLTVLIYLEKESPRRCCGARALFSIGINASCALERVMYLVFSHRSSVMVSVTLTSKRCAPGSGSFSRIEMKSSMEERSRCPIPAERKSACPINSDLNSSPLRIWISQQLRTLFTPTMVAAFS